MKEGIAIIQVNMHKGLNRVMLRILGQPRWLDMGVKKWQKLRELLSEFWFHISDQIKAPGRKSNF